MRLSRKYIGLIIIGILILIFVVYNLTSTPNDYKITSNNMSTNNFVGYGVSFNFPSDWNLTTDNNGFDSSQGIIITVSPNEENDEAPLFEVLIMPNQGMSDQDAINAAINTSTNPSSWHLISNKTTTVDNITAYINYFTVDDPAHYTQNMTLEYVYMVENGTTYTLIVSAPLNEFNNDQANFNTMINSFKIL